MKGKRGKSFKMAALVAEGKIFFIHEGKAGDISEGEGTGDISEEEGKGDISEREVGAISEG